MDLISVVVPCYNEEESLPIFLEALAVVARGMRERHEVSFEVVLVDDGSTDDTLKVMKRASEQARVDAADSVPLLDIH